MRYASTDVDDHAKTTHTVDCAKMRLVPIELQVSLSFLMKIEAFVVSLREFSSNFDFVKKSIVLKKLYETMNLWYARNEED
jgi:hypothetical protein